MDGIARTLQFVRDHVPYYRDRAEDFDITRIESFPVIDKKFLEINNELLFILDKCPSTIAMTGGTTGNSATFLVRSEEEKNRIDEARSMFFREHGFGRTMGDKLGTLSILDSHHGIASPNTNVSSLLSVPLETQKHIAIIQKLLLSGLPVQDFRILFDKMICSVTKLKILTEYCHYKSIPAFNYHLNDVYLTSFHLSEKWRTIIESYWGCQTHEVYGLAEFPEINSIKCDSCGGYHFPPLAHVEVLKFQSDDPAPKGMGRLVLSSIIPYRQAMPLIRFDTGDIVKKTSCHEYSVDSYQFLGRKTLGAYSSECDRFLSPFSIIRALDNEIGDFIELHHRIPYLMSGEDTNLFAALRNVGHPMISISHSGPDPKNLVVVVGIKELMFDLRKFRKAAGVLASSLNANGEFGVEFQFVRSSDFVDRRCRLTPV